MSMDKIIMVQEDNFEDEVLENNKLVLVDCWAEWSGPCKKVKPILNQLAGELDTVVFTSLNVDENKELADRYSIITIPTFLLFKDGGLVDRTMGALPKSDLENFIARNM